jgi:hypothetical protein
MLDLEAIKARLEATRPGTWRLEHNHAWFRVVLGKDAQGTGAQGAHLELLAHAAEDLAALVAEVERLRAAS